MPEFFRPYEGDKPFFFVSYSHRNTDFVLETITALRQKPFLFWYDEGIPAGSDWPKNIADHMDRCSTVLFFRSQFSFGSPNCLSEIATARERGKKILCVPLDEAKPVKEREKWEAALADAEYLPPAVSPIALADALSADPRLLPFSGEEADYRVSAGGKTQRRVGDLVLLLLALVVLLGGSSVYIQRQTALRPAPTETPVATETPVPAPTPDVSQWEELFRRPVSFGSNKQIEDSVRRALAEPTAVIYVKELVDIREMLFCGDNSTTNSAAVSRSENGTWLLFDRPLVEGTVTELNFFTQMPYLERLTLIDQPIVSLAVAGEAAFPSLKALSLAGCKHVTLDGIGGMPALETLALEYSGVRDLTPLSALPALRTVTVSADMFPMTLDKNATYDVILVR